MQYNNILVITLSSIGDCFLTLPAVDILRYLFHQAKITVMVGPRVAEIFQDNFFVDRVIIFDKYSGILNKIKLSLKLRADAYDLVIDFRNTAFPIFIKAKSKTNPFLITPKNIMHMKDRNLWRLQKVIKQALPQDYKKSFSATDRDIDYIDTLLKEQGVTEGGKLIAVSPGAMSFLKRWTAQGFTDFCNLVLENYRAKIILAGIGIDKDIIEEVYAGIKKKVNVVNLYGKTSLRQLCALFKRCDLLLANDTGTAHLASYLDTPVLVICGPGDERRYGPWGRNGHTVRKYLACAPCQKAECPFNTAACMKTLSGAQVFAKVKDILQSLNC